VTATRTKTAPPAGSGERRRSFALSPFGRMVTSSGLSNLADGVFVVALPLVALGITRDPSAFAGVTFVGRLPWLLFALPAGALADRLDRRRTMVLVDVGRTALIAVLAALVATDNEELWALYVVAFALGIGETLFDTAAQSIVPSIVPADRLARANSRLYAVELTANQFVGPPLGGVLVAAAAALALWTSAGAYALAAVALLALHGSFRPDRGGARTTIRRDIVEGVRYLAGHRILRALALCVGLMNLAFTAQFAVIPLFIVEPGPMGLSESGFGLLLTAAAVGALVGSAITPRVEAALGRTRALIVAVVMVPIGTVTPAVTAAVAPFAIALAVTGVLNVVWNVITVSLRQRIVPDVLLGRVNAGYRLVAWGTMPLGALLGGAIADLVSIRAVFWTAAGLSLLCVPILLTQVSDAAIADAEADADAARTSEQ
jgi:MFS family permease